MKLLLQKNRTFNSELLNENKVNEWKEKISETRNKKTARVNKSMFLAPIERELLTEFLSNNQNLCDKEFSIGLFYMSYFWQIGAIPDELISAISCEKSPNIDYISIKLDNLNLSHLKKWNNLSKKEWKEKLKEKGRPQPISGRATIFEAVEEFRKEKKFSTFAMFMKECMISLGIYPKNAIEVVREHFRIIPDDIEKHMTPAQLKIKIKRQEKNAEKLRLKNIMKKKNPDNLLDLAKISVACLPPEQKYVEPFMQALKDANITFSGLMRYTIIKTNIAPVTMKKEAYKRCESFKYNPNNNIESWYTCKLQKENAYGKKRTNNNISILRETKAVMEEKLGKKCFPKWIRENIFLPYGVYPKMREKGKNFIDLYAKNYKKG